MAAVDIIGGDSGLGGYDPNGQSEQGGYTGSKSIQNSGDIGIPTPPTAPISNNPIDGGTGGIWGAGPSLPQASYPTTFTNISSPAGDPFSTPPSNVQAGVQTSNAGGGDLMSRITGALQAAGSTDDPNYWYQKISADPNGQGSAWNYWVGRINQGNGAAAVRNGTTPLFNDSGGGNTAATPQTNPYGGTGIFNDPATQQYEQMLNSIIGRFSQPYTPPSLQPALDYLGQYFQQLQGPAYTPAQMDLQKTQLFDPIMQQRDASNQQIIQSYAKRGISPDSGIVQKAIQDNNMQFERLGTQAESSVANNAIGLQKQQQSQAASLGPQIAALEQGNYQNQNQNLLQAANLASIVPQLAWQRLTGAQSGVTPINPVGLLSGLQQFQNQGYNQGANFSNGLMQILSQLFGGSGTA